jgi:hypothetical protein
VVGEYTNMFFFLVGIVIGIMVAQENPDLPNAKGLLKTASTMLRDTVRGEVSEGKSE